ncbi:hypothetical protein V2J09_001737 [Rumex salicifolius]
MVLLDSPRSLGGNAIRTYSRTRKRSREVVVPFMKRRSGLRFVGDQLDDNEAPVFDWTNGAHGFVYDNLYAQINSAVNVTKVHVEATGKITARRTTFFSKPKEKIQFYWRKLIQETRVTKEIIPYFA